MSALAEKGYEAMDGLGNYIFIKTHKTPQEVAERLKEEEKVLVKTFGSPLLSGYIRVSTGSQEAMGFFMDKFLKADC